MSNASIKAGLRLQLVSFAPERCGDFSRALETAVEGFEKLPYPLRAQGQSLALAFLHHSWGYEEGLAVDARADIERVKAWLEEVPE